MNSHTHDWGTRTVCYDGWKAVHKFCWTCGEREVQSTQTGFWEPQSKLDAATEKGYDPSDWVESDETESDES